MKKKNNFSAAFKAKTGCAALRESKTINELSFEHGVHTTQINRWRKIIVEDGAILFEQTSKKSNQPVDY